ncbi:MAG: hypothetical protein PVG20_04030 [Thioalkalispiraceae bacterium]|jgi:hypothetical protein
MKTNSYVTRLLIGPVFLGLIFLSGCQQQPKNQMIMFIEQEQGVDPYQTRLLVTPEFIRFDDGNKSSSFLLFDRKKNIAYNVDHDTKTIMRVESKKINVNSPFELKYLDKKVDDLKDAPSIKNIKPIHRQLLTNDQVCLDVVSVDGLMPEAVLALKEYHLLLASDSASTFNNIPADMQDPCDISMSTFAPIRHLEYGFPVHEWKPGYTRHLKTYDDDYQVAPELLKLPEDYFAYSVQEFREGRVDLKNRKILPAVNSNPKPPQTTDISPATGKSEKKGS